MFVSAGVIAGNMLLLHHKFLKEGVLNRWQLSEGQHFFLCLVWSNEQDSATEFLTYTTVSAVCCQKILSSMSQMKYSTCLHFTLTASTAVANEPEHKTFK